jgi:hypothetical protein
MITIIKNVNFGNWFDVRIFGELVDNARTEVKALAIAKQIQTQAESNGERLLIVRDKEII